MKANRGHLKTGLLIEHDPHQLIEGMILASYAIGAKLAFIYCRGEFFEGIAILRKAVEAGQESRLSWEQRYSEPIFPWILSSIRGPEPISQGKKPPCSIPWKDIARHPV